MPPIFDLATLDILSRLRVTKEAFTPSPAVAQGVMAQAQGAGGDPAAGGAPPGAGAPPGMDPAAMAAAGGGAPPGAGGPPPGAGAPTPDGGPGGGGAGPVQDAMANQIAELKQLILSQSQGGAGPGGKPNMASLKFEPQHFHAMVHKINNMETVLTRIADAMGLEIPASSLLGQPSPGTPADAPGGPSSPQAQGGAPAPAAGPAGPPPSQVAQALPSLPPVAQAAPKQASLNLFGGYAVPPLPEDNRRLHDFADLTSAFRKGGGW